MTGVNLFSQLQKVTVANPRNPGFDFLVKHAKNSLFEIQKHTFVALGLSTNGLSQMVNPDPDDTNVYIVVEDGDNATFLKNSNRGTQKSHTFKNIQLMNLLAETYNIETGTKLILEEVDKNNNLYRLVPEGEQAQISESHTGDVTHMGAVASHPVPEYEEAVDEAPQADMSDGVPMEETEDEVSLFD